MVGVKSFEIGFLRRGLFDFVQEVLTVLIRGLKLVILTFIVKLLPKTLLLQLPPVFLRVVFVITPKKFLDFQKTPATAHVQIVPHYFSLNLEIAF